MCGDEGSRIPHSGRHILVPPSMRLRSLTPASVRAFPPFGRRSLRCGIRFVLRIYCKKKELPLFATVLSDGDEGSRIPYLLHAMQAL